MPRKKKNQAMSYKELEDLFNKTEETRCELYKENQMLRKQLDLQTDRYNLVDTAQIKTNNINKYIDVNLPQLNIIEQPYQINQYLKEFFAKGVAISWLKNHDYGNGDVFGNFREFGTQGFLVRMSDKWARIKTFAASGSLLVKDENVLDTLIDLANYCALLGAWLHNQKLLGEQSKLEQPR